MAFNLHSKRWNQTAKFLGLVRCPHCQERGGIWEAHDPEAQGTGWVRYCYKCSYLVPAERRIDRAAREREVARRMAQNRRKIADLEQIMRERKAHHRQ